MIGKVGMTLVTTVDFVAVQIGIIFEAHLRRDYRPVFVKKVRCMRKTREAVPRRETLRGAGSSSQRLDSEVAGVFRS